MYNVCKVKYLIWIIDSERQLDPLPVAVDWDVAVGIFRFVRLCIHETFCRETTHIVLNNYSPFEPDLVFVAGTEN